MQRSDSIPCCLFSSEAPAALLLMCTTAEKQPWLEQAQACPEVSDLAVTLAQVVDAPYRQAPSIDRQVRGRCGRRNDHADITAFHLAPLSVPLLMSVLALQMSDVPSLYWFGLLIRQ
jgi:hypothetical protein